MLKLKEVISYTKNVFIVRLKVFNEIENIAPYGTMLWPEALMACTLEEATELLNELNQISFDMHKDFYYEVEPDGDLDEEELFMSWQKHDHFQYIIEEVSDLKEYENLYRIGESEIAYANVIEDKNLLRK